MKELHTKKNRRCFISALEAIGIEGDYADEAIKHIETIAGEKVSLACSDLATAIDASFGIFSPITIIDLNAESICAEFIEGSYTGKHLACVTGNFWHYFDRA